MFSFYAAMTNDHTFDGLNYTHWFSYSHYNLPPQMLAEVPSFWLKKDIIPLLDQAHFWPPEGTCIPWFMTHVFFCRCD